MAKESESQAQKRELGPRSWMISLLWAAVIVGVSIIASATVNPLFGRYVHWDWMAVLAPILFLVLTMALRNRWA